MNPAVDEALSPPDAPVFHAPWEARVFGLVVSLCQAGVFTWAQWTETLVRHTKASPCGEATYEIWLDALEDLLVVRDSDTRAVLDGLRAAWRLAAETTPHGRPIELPAEVLASVLTSRGGK